MLLERIVIGSNVESLLYAFLYDSYHLPNTSHLPIFYEKIEQNLLGSERTDYTWSRLQTILALSGRLLNYENVRNIKIQGQEIKIATDSSFFKYEFEECIIFDTTDVNLENTLVEQKEDKYHVYDDFELSRLGSKHKYLPPKNTKHILAPKIMFYISNRVDGANYVTDSVAESILTKKQLENIEYSDSIVRFAILRYLESIGIQGNFMNFYKNGTKKYRKPKVTHKSRTIRRVEQNIYENTEKVKIIKPSIKEILDEFSTTRP